jgi:hypothetical protein
MRRREFVRLFGGVVAMWPLTTGAHAFRDLKWIEGSNVHVDYRWATGDASRTQAYAAELVSLAPDVILATNTPTVRSLHQLTKTIPIVFAGLSDPIGDGFVTSLSKPGGNITGFSSLDAAIIGKWFATFERDRTKHRQCRRSLQPANRNPIDLFARARDGRSRVWSYNHQSNGARRRLD